MCAYNVRQNRSLDHDPATGHARKLNLIREVAAWAIGIATMYGVYLLVRRFLF
jgi:hypothetical protein